MGLLFHGEMKLTPRNIAGNEQIGQVFDIKKISFVKL